MSIHPHDYFGHEVRHRAGVAHGAVATATARTVLAFPAERDWSFEIRMPRLPEVVDDAPDYEVREPVDHNVALKGDTYLVEDTT